MQTTPHRRCFLVPELRHDAAGHSAIEYAMVAALISIVGVSLFLSIGGELTDLFTQVASSF